MPQQAKSPAFLLFDRPVRANPFVGWKSGMTGLAEAA